HRTATTITSVGNRNPANADRVGSHGPGRYECFTVQVRVVLAPANHRKGKFVKWLVGGFGWSTGCWVSAGDQGCYCAVGWGLVAWWAAAPPVLRPLRAAPRPRHGPGPVRWPPAGPTAGV